MSVQSSQSSQSTQSTQSFKNEFKHVEHKQTNHKRSIIPAVQLKSPCIVVVIRNQLSYLIFEYESEFIKQLSKRKADLNISWNKENSRWEFATQNLLAINDFLFSSNIQFIQDDRRKGAKVSACALLVIGEKQASLLFEYDSNLVKIVSQRKKELKLFWNIERKKWQLSSQNLNNVIQLLHENNVIFLMDDRRQ